MRADDGVPVLGPGTFRSHIAGEPARLSRDAVDRLAGHAVTALPAQRPGGGDPPLPPMAVKKAVWARRTGLGSARETDAGTPPED